MEGPGHYLDTLAERIFTLDSLAGCVAGGTRTMSKPVKNTKRKAKGKLLSAKELGILAEKLAATQDPAQSKRLCKRITAGFYGTKPPE